jgi:hypothetical protein
MRTICMLVRRIFLITSLTVKAADKGSKVLFKGTRKILFELIGLTAHKLTGQNDDSTQNA